MRRTKTCEKKQAMLAELAANVGVGDTSGDGTQEHSCLARETAETKQSLGPKQLREEGPHPKCRRITEGERRGERGGGRRGGNPEQHTRSRVGSQTTASALKV